MKFKWCALLHIVLQLIRSNYVYNWSYFIYSLLELKLVALEGYFPTFMDDCGGDLYFVLRVCNAHIWQEEGKKFLCIGGVVCIANANDWYTTLLHELNEN